MSSKRLLLWLYLIITTFAFIFLSVYLYNAFYLSTKPSIFLGFILIAVTVYSSFKPLIKVAFSNDTIFTAKDSVSIFSLKKILEIVFIVACTGFLLYMLLDSFVRNKAKLPFLLITAYPLLASITPAFFFTGIYESGFLLRNKFYSWDKIDCFRIDKSSLYLFEDPPCDDNTDKAHILILADEDVSTIGYFLKEQGLKSLSR